jgi:hypothetical protein
LRDVRKTIDEMFDYRYSRLLFVLAWTIREGDMKEESLAGLSEDKLEPVRSLAG